MDQIIHDQEKTNCKDQYVWIKKVESDTWMSTGLESVPSPVHITHVRHWEMDQCKSLFVCGWHNHFSIWEWQTYNKGKQVKRRDIKIYGIKLPGCQSWKTEFLILSKKRNMIHKEIIKIGGAQINASKSVRLLGMMIDNASW